MSHLRTFIALSTMQGSCHISECGRYNAQQLFNISASSSCDVKGAFPRYLDFATEAHGQRGVCGCVEHIHTDCRQAVVLSGTDL